MNEYNNGQFMPPAGPPYNMQPNGDFSYDFFEHERKKRTEKRELRGMGMMTGAAVLLVFLAQNIVSVILYMFGLYDDYLNNSMFQMGIDMLLTVVSVLLPFLLFGSLMKKRSGCADLIPLGKPRDRKLSLLAIPAGLGICMVANIVTSYLVAFLKIFSVELSSPDISDPTGVGGFVVSVLRVCVVAAMVEEISFRGCAMQPLRKYGEFFAILMSACAFGLMHCNLVQAPFALIVGLGLGYISVKTDTLWLSIIIHALNNFISTAFTYLLDSNVDQNTVNILYSSVIYIIMFGGIVCFVLFVRRSKKYYPPIKPTSSLTTAQKVGAYILNPTMIIAIIMVLFYTSKFIKLS